MKWINAEIQKPEEDEEILAKNDFGKIVDGEAFYDDGVLCCGNGDEMISHVVCWMSSPKESELPV